MTTITNKNGVIECSGHAGSHEHCAMLTALSVALVTNIEDRLGESVNHKLTSGYFMIDIDGLSERAVDLVEAFWFAVKGLAANYPAYIRIE